jgi:hypothetical protein
MTVSLLRAPTEAPVDQFELYTRGHIPDALEGELLAVTGQRFKARRRYSNWHFSPATLLRMTLEPGTPGRVRVSAMPIQRMWSDAAEDLGGRPVDPIAPDGVPTCAPNHAVNRLGGTTWVTNLLFGPPLQVETDSGSVVRVVSDRPLASDQRISTTAHFAQNASGSLAFLHQLTLTRRSSGAASSGDHEVLALDTDGSLAARWQVRPPEGDDPASANFHSSFWFEVDGVDHLGLVRTGVVVANWDGQHAGRPSPAAAAALWLVPLPRDRSSTTATLVPLPLPMHAVALSHLDWRAEHNGFTLYANWKQANVAQVTEGVNVYGRDPDRIAEHYVGATVEPFDVGGILRLRWWPTGSDLAYRSIPYDPGRTSALHTWMPINIHLSRDRRSLFGSFAGVNPRLIADAASRQHPVTATDFAKLRYVPPLIARFDADTLEPADTSGRTHASYADAIATTLVERDDEAYVVSLSARDGLRIYAAADLQRLVGFGVNARLQHVDDALFRTEPAHLQFVAARSC